MRIWLGTYWLYTFTISQKALTHFPSLNKAANLALLRQGLSPLISACFTKIHLLRYFFLREFSMLFNYFDYFYFAFYFFCFAHILRQFHIAFIHFWKILPTNTYQNISFDIFSIYTFKFSFHYIWYLVIDLHYFLYFHRF